MNHSFNVEIATKYGMLEAIILEHFNFWIAKNRANEVNFYDGYYWTYSSSKALAELFPYASQKTISRVIHHLEEEGLIILGNYNKSAYDRTMWYALTEKGNSIVQNGIMHLSKCQMEEPEMSNGNSENVQPIPDISTDIETDNNTVSDDTVRQTDVRRVIDAWNSLSDCGIRPVSKIGSGSKRYISLTARIREYGIGSVLEAIKNIRNSNFLQGKAGGKRQWVITFDWFVLPSNFPKVLEGNYSDKLDSGGKIDGNVPNVRAPGKETLDGEDECYEDESYIDLSGMSDEEYREFLKRQIQK